MFKPRYTLIASVLIGLFWIIFSFRASFLYMEFRYVILSHLAFFILFAFTLLASLKAYQTESEAKAAEKEWEEKREWEILLHKNRLALNEQKQKTPEWIIEEYEKIQDKRQDAQKKHLETPQTDLGLLKEIQKVVEEEIQDTSEENAHA